MIANIQLKGSFPTAADYFSSADYLSILNDESMSVIVPLMVSVNEEFFLEYSDQATVSGQANYRIPKRSVVSGLRDCQLIDTSGNVTQLARLFEDGKTTVASQARGYYLKGNQVVLSPTPTDSTMTLRLAYFRRPQSYVLPTACAQVSAINTVSNIVTVSSAPSTFATGVLLDFVQGATPYDTLAFDQAVVGISGTAITFSSLPTGLALGDWLSLSTQTCVPGIPEEVVPLLVQAALVTCLSAKKDNAVSVEKDKMERMAQNLLRILAPRVRDNSVKINNLSGPMSRFQRYW